MGAGVTDVPRAAVDAPLAQADAAFAAGDAERWTDCFAQDGRVLLLHREALVGRAAIHELWQASWARLDTSDWHPVTELVEVHGGDACVWLIARRPAMSAAE
jgi:ketosteroid isomerase-like protein